jgi:hypothetical protein
MSDIKMTPVISSHIRAVGQYGTTLRLQFKSGKTFDYKRAAHHHEPMVQSDSPGNYFHANIRNNKEHPFSEVTE